MSEQFNETNEMEQKVNLLVLTPAEGSIGTEFTPELQKLSERLVGGEFNKKISETSIICKCIDGRNCTHGAIEGPNSAGGSLSLLVATDLVGNTRYLQPDEPIANGMSRLAADFTERGLPVGVHSDDHAEGDASGCGANDKLSLIYSMMAKKQDDVRTLAAGILAAEIPEELHDKIISRAESRTAFSTGADVRAAVLSAAGDTASETVEGAHKEIVAIINKEAGTTLDRDALETETSGEYQAFNVDAWAFEQSSREVANDEAEVFAHVVALTYYNLSTALVLCGSNMRVGVHE